MEALVVVAIIAISAAIAAPAIGEAMADRRASEAAQRLVRLGVRGQSEAQAYGRAHILRFADGTDGTVELWRGTSNLCTGNDWEAITTGGCAAPYCIDAIDMAEYTMGSQQARLRLPGATTADLCFQPDGEMLVSSGGGVFGTVAPSGTEGVRFTITRRVGGSTTGVQRLIVFPFGATPRIVR